MQKRKLRLACVRKRNRQAELEERKNKNRKELCSEREVGGGGREGGKEGRKEGKRVRNRATAHQTTIRKETNRTAITTIAIRRNTPRTMVETSSPVLSATQQITKQGGTLKHGKNKLSCSWHGTISSDNCMSKPLYLHLSAVVYQGSTNLTEVL